MKVIVNKVRNGLAKEGMEYLAESDTFYDTICALVRESLTEGIPANLWVGDGGASVSVFIGDSTVSIPVKVSALYDAEWPAVSEGQIDEARENIDEMKRFRSMIDAKIAESEASIG